MRLLVRDKEKAERIYQTLGATLPEFVIGDVTDRSSLATALKDCDAVLHAAAATPMQIDSVEQLFAVNVNGVKNVVGEALAAGVGRIVCLSSVTALFDPDPAKVSTELPPKPSKQPYGQSKVEAELFLREQQAKGAPISILYPGGIIGPDDPGFSDSCKAIKHRLEQGFRIFGDGGMQFIDVRDLAAFARSLLTEQKPEKEQGRYLLPGVFSTWTEQADMIEQLSGASLTRIPAQGWKLRLVGRAIDTLRLFKKVDSPISAETMRYATLWPRIENTAALEDLGLALRDTRQSFDDTLRWMVESGHLDAKLCPKYASPQ